MKLINTLSIFIFLFIAVACSSESDSVMNDIENKNEVPASKEVVAVFNISLSGQAIQSRSADAEPEDANPKESEIKNCFIAAVSENGTVLCSFTSNNPSDIKMLVKVSDTYQPVLTFVAVANVGDQAMNDLLQSKNLSSIEKVTLTETPETLVKVGFNKVNSYSISEGNKTDITIPLTQRTAAVELASLIVDDNNVVVESLELVNVKNNTKVKGEGTADYIASSILTIHDNNYTSARLYAYENTSDTKTAIKIIYTYKGVVYDRTYTIKTDKIEKILSGKLYKLDVKISSSSAAIEFEVKDWTLNEINLGTIDGTQIKK